VFVPKWVGGIGRARELARRIGEGQVLKRVPQLLPAMDDEVRRLGRSTSVRNVAHQAAGAEGDR
jgi:hypothetical protein